MTARVILNASVVGKIAEETVGLKQLTKDFNEYRQGKDIRPVESITVKRYNGGYETTPAEYRKFLSTYVALI